MKTQVNTQDTMRPELTHALLVYEDEGSAYVTLHRVATVKGRPRIGPGGPASRAALATLAAKLQKAAALAGFTPPNLVYMSPQLLAWWRPAAPARVFFDCPKEVDKGAIGKRSAITPQPGLLFGVTPRDWYVWALAGADRPGPDTPVHRAHYFNVWRSGRICTGNVKLPDRLDPGVLGQYESAFFDSNFTHANDAKGLTRHKGGVYRLWRELLEGQHKTFPVRSLPASTQTVATLITDLEDRNAK